MSFVEELKWRGLLQQQTDPGLERLMSAEPFVLYIGFDPTASSLHVGSLLPVLALVRAQRAGHRPIAVVGGATGMIGDPSGKTDERKLLSREEIADNLAGIGSQLGRFLDFSTTGGARLVDNYEWFDGLGYLAFLREVGKHFSVNMMLAKESVRARLEDREHGISYTEFSYMLIQAYDFLMLHDRYGCRLQVGGSDQWGNITAGIELIRRLRQKDVYGLTQPLLTTASGQKFGKTERGAVWLDPERTSPYDFFQFFIQTDDRDVVRFLRYYTLLDAHTIDALEETVRSAPEKREAQRVLAREVSRLVHGAEAAAAAESAAGALFAGEIDAVLREASTPQTRFDVGRLADAGLSLVSVLSEIKVSTSSSAARRDVAAGGIYVNGERVVDIDRRLTIADLKDRQAIVLRKGKKSWHILRFA